MRRLTCCLVAVLMTLGACSGGGIGQWKIFQKETPVEQLNAEDIYKRGELELAQENYGDAYKTFSEIERLYPYSAFAERGILMQAFAAHREGEYELSRSAAQRYLDFYPANDDAPYAQYLVALSYYDQIDDVGRDQAITVSALESLEQLFARYPDSEYAQSAELKFELAFDHLAGKEMEVGRYYLDKDHFAASARRFRVVIEKFQTTSHTPEALFRLIEANLALGLDQEAQTAGAILGYNYQNTDWYRDGYALLRENGLKSRLFEGNWLGRFYRESLSGEWR